MAADRGSLDRSLSDRGGGGTPLSDRVSDRSLLEGRGPGSGERLSLLERGGAGDSVRPSPISDRSFVPRDRGVDRISAGSLGGGGREWGGDSGGSTPREREYSGGYSGRSGVAGDRYESRYGPGAPDRGFGTAKLDAIDSRSGTGYSSSAPPPPPPVRAKSPPYSSSYIPEAGEVNPERGGYADRSDRDAYSGGSSWNNSRYRPNDPPPAVLSRDSGSSSYRSSRGPLDRSDRGGERSGGDRYSGRPQPPGGSRDYLSASGGVIGSASGDYGRRDPRGDIRDSRDVREVRDRYPGGGGSGGGGGGGRGVFGGDPERERDRDDPKNIRRSSGGGSSSSSRLPPPPPPPSASR
ncbi:hypothetical protein BDR26DRAFT_890419 [Obelidium mucronatum]|nr:hypothetical protein BDR26DRAFT_890419 [Obelidium mucronatum]